MSPCGRRSARSSRIPAETLSGAATNDDVVVPDESRSQSPTLFVTTLSKQRISHQYVVALGIEKNRRTKLPMRPAPPMTSALLPSPLPSAGDTFLLLRRERRTDQQAHQVFGKPGR